MKHAENKTGDYHDCTTSVSATRRIVDRAMELLDPLPPQQLEPFHVAQAYDALLDCFISNHDERYCSSSTTQISLHPRLVHAIRTTTKPQEKDEQKTLTSLSLSPPWIELQADIFRGLLVSSYLLLELCGGHVHNDDDNDDKEVDDDDVTTIANNCSSPPIRLPTTLSTASIQILQQTIKRCTLLLQLLVQSSFQPQSQHTKKKQEPSSLVPPKTNKHKKDTTHNDDKNGTNTSWKSYLPPSRYPLLQVALEDGLLPANTQQQKEWFESSSSSLSPLSLAENQLLHVEEGPCGTHNKDDDDDDDEDAMVIDMDPSRLAEDEQILIAMASAEIPLSTDNNGSSEMNNRTNYRKFARQGNLELVIPTSTPTTARNHDINHSSSSSSSLVETTTTTTTIPVHVKLFRCGLLWIQQVQQPQDNNKEEDTTNSTQKNTAMPHAHPQEKEQQEQQEQEQEQVQQEQVQQEQVQQQQQQQLWCLDTTSTCQLQPRNNEFCFCIQNIRNVISSFATTTTTPSKDNTNDNYYDHVNTGMVLLQVPSGLAEGSAWVNVIQRIISYNMVNHEEMQRLIRIAWTENNDDEEQYQSILQSCRDTFQQVINDTV